MNNPEKNLSKNLKEVTEIYLKISEIEEEKQKAILERNGKDLENLSYLQDSHVAQLNILEEKRETAIKQFCEKHSIDYNISYTLKELLQNVKTQDASDLLEQAESLKNLLFRLVNARETNNTLLEDNIKYFNEMLDELKYSSSSSMGYGSNGKDNGNYNAPLFLNRTT